MDKKEQNFNFRLMKREEKNKFIECFEASTSHPLGGIDSSLHFDWCYLNNPDGDLMVVFAEDNGKVSAIYAVIPRRFKVLDKNILCSQSLNTVTHPAYRMKGLFVKSASVLYNHIAKNGVIFTYGFPSSSSVKGLTKYLNWRLLGQLPLLVRVLTTKSIIIHIPKLSKILEKLPSLKFGIRPHFPFFKKSESILREFKNFDFRFDELWGHSSKEIGIGGVRDFSYLQWRFVERPFSPYRKILAEDSKGKLLGYIVFIVREKHQCKTGYIMDMLTYPKDFILRDKLIFYSLKKMKEEKADQVLAITPYSHSSFINYLLHGFIPMWEKFFPNKIYFGVVVHSSSSEAFSLYNPKNWYISFADFDTD